MRSFTQYCYFTEIEIFDLGETCTDLEQVYDNTEMDLRGIHCILVNWIEMVYCIV
jgi:hypothetical protein